MDDCFLTNWQIWYDGNTVYYLDENIHNNIAYVNSKYENKDKDYFEDYIRESNECGFVVKLKKTNKILHYISGCDAVIEIEDKKDRKFSKIGTLYADQYGKMYIVKNNTLIEVKEVK